VVPRDEGQARHRRGHPGQRVLEDALARGHVAGDDQGVDLRPARLCRDQVHDVGMVIDVQIGGEGQAH
jgi:hypothetical protein